MAFSLSLASPPEAFFTRLETILASDSPSAPGTHPMKREDSREKLRNTSNGRRRYYFDDGSWTWCYSCKSPLAYRNRENGIPCLEDLEQKT